MSDQTKRALIVTRLSRVTDATTSPERQLQICEELCGQRGYEIVGHAEDLDVSGAVDPFDRKKRPSLSRWLANAAEPFDVLVAYRVDRFTRSIRHLQQLVNWADDNGKLVVSATEPHFDTASPFAAVVIALMGTVAQMELEAISERNASTAQFNIKAGRYRGSQPPWGYLPDNETGEWRLKPDPEQVEVITEVSSRVIDGEPLQRIAHELTRRGVLTPKDLFARHRGRELQNREWSVTQLKRSLLSEAMLGYAPSKTAGDHFVEYLKEQFNWKPSRTPFHTTAKRGCGRCGAVKPGSEFDVPVTPARPDLNVCRKCSHGKEFK